MTIRSLTTTLAIAIGATFALGAFVVTPAVAWEECLQSCDDFYQTCASSATSDKDLHACARSQRDCDKSCEENDHASEHNSDHSSDHASEHSSDHGSEHSSDHASDHSSDHGSEHSSDHASEHSSDHGSEH